ncbi:SpoIIE family protein phosphatase [Heliobacterium gestii]|uniref:SpoIIE family protein phosphatase n=1 Tax=Heliomicrobium gestii TaxID=2699 RepID=A0A845LCR4_HELGE|nr:SpoIIE family protein phosphatase [Heliomicrobium gestii]MBM7865944.1 serine phosphatase RsbU (regulator of sigma subunit) [Heliomicrobium gestii]MZP42720.1 SpoIIE family protein phosphatase [Heliomicrobium gestii]
MGLEKEKGLLEGGRNVLYDRGAMKVIVLATAMITLAVLLTGVIGYSITRTGVIDKLKTKDLHYIARSMAARIDGRLERATETARLLASDPTVTEWVATGERDDQLGDKARQKLVDIARDHGYVNTFIVSAQSRNYWGEQGKIMQTMDPQDPYDRWFFDFLASKAPLQVHLDYNKARQNTYIFVNARIGSAARAYGVAGVGLSLEDLAQEFQQYRFSAGSRLWLVDEKGAIHLSDSLECNGKNLADYLPDAIEEKVLFSANDQGETSVMEYVDGAGNRLDLISQPIRATGWKLVFQVPRAESLAVLNSILVNMFVTGLLSVTLICIVFYIVSRRIADPYRRALELNEELERIVGERTRELSEKNRKIMDSIDYAKRLQDAVLPAPYELGELFAEHFLIWRPRDVVGGDFLWIRRYNDDECIVAVGDCTGHGVPGALMTMAVTTMLNHIADERTDEAFREDPAEILRRLHQAVRETIQKKADGETRYDGLDIGLCSIKGRRVVFAGAGMDLYQSGASTSVTVMKGGRKSIGHPRFASDDSIENRVVEVGEGDFLYLTTDGYLDQNGGVQDYSFGKRRFKNLIAGLSGVALPAQQEIFTQTLSDYMGEEAQRDDITVLVFTPRAARDVSPKGGGRK